MCDRRRSVTRLVEWLYSRKPTSFDTLILLRPLRSEATLEKRIIAPPKASRHVVRVVRHFEFLQSRAAAHDAGCVSSRAVVFAGVGRYGPAEVSFYFRISIIYDHFICKTESLPYVPLNIRLACALSKDVVHVCTLPLDCSLILNLK